MRQPFNKEDFVALKDTELSVASRKLNIGEALDATSHILTPIRILRLSSRSSHPTLVGSSMRREAEAR
jgi:hypothetical protein